MTLIILSSGCTTRIFPNDRIRNDPINYVDQEDMAITLFKFQF